mmetsp:Transcript_47773/g.89411  ORF Transcript_47773/g.89411 Transcript_47773/m.89411 type:complete len:245 (-) Transcript_47773:109-843(-)
MHPTSSPQALDRRALLRSDILPPRRPGSGIGLVGTMMASTTDVVTATWPDALRLEVAEVEARRLVFAAGHRPCSEGVAVVGERSTWRVAHSFKELLVAVAMPGNSWAPTFAIHSIARAEEHAVERQLAREDAGLFCAAGEGAGPNGILPRSQGGAVLVACPFEVLLALEAVVAIRRRALRDFRHWRQRSGRRGRGIAGDGVRRGLRGGLRRVAQGLQLLRHVGNAGQSRDGIHELHTRVVITRL